MDQTIVSRMAQGDASGAKSKMQMPNGASVTCDIGGKVYFFGKRITLKRAIMNILQNAIPDGGSANIVVTTRDDEVAIVVADNGPGIDPKNIGVVFQPFRRLDSSCSRDSEGFGLGLSIAQIIIEDHGGTISLQNRSVRGLRVAIILPRTAMSLPGKPKGKHTGRLH